VWNRPNQQRCFIRAIVWIAALIASAEIVRPSSSWLHLASTAQAAGRGFSHLVSEPPVPSADHLEDFVARDQDIVTQMSFDPDQVESRLSQIRTLEQDYQAMQPNSREASQLGNNILSLHLQQALYLENLRGLGLKDKRFPDIDHFIKVSRRQVIAYAQQLRKAHANSPYGKKWQVSEIVSRIRIGDATVYREAIAFVKNQKTGSQAVRVQALGAALTATKKTTLNYGSLQSALNLPLDAHSRAALKLIGAEILATKNQAAARSLFQEAAREGLGIRTPAGNTGPITERAAARLLQLELAGRPKNPDQEVVTFLQAMGLAESAHFYVERCALNNLPQRHKESIQIYDSLQNLKGVSDELSKQIAMRTLDIALSAKDLDSTEERWRRLSRYESEMATKEAFSRVLQTQNMAWQSYQKKPTPAAVEQFVRLHDVFTRTSQLYAQEDTWKLRTLEALSRINNHAALSSRADAVAQEAKSKQVKVAALRYSARAKESLMGITAAPSFSRNPNLSGGSGLVSAYLKVLDELIPLSTGTEKERAQFQLAYLTQKTKNEDEGRKLLLATLAQYRRSPLAGPAATFLLDESMAKSDYVFTELVVRNLKKWNIAASGNKYKKLDDLLEFVVFEQGKSLASQDKYEEAANKFVAFQNEFPKSSNADVALHLASRNYTSARKIDESIKQMERLIEIYPKSKLAKETSWAAAQQSKSIGQLLRSAKHYTEFATKYPKDGVERKAWYEAALLHKSLGRFSDSIASFEKHMTSSPDQREKVAIAKEIAELQRKYGSTSEAIASYDRVIKMAQNPADTVWAQFNMVELFLRQGMELEARAASKKLLSVSVSDTPSLTAQAKTRFNIGKLDAAQMKEIDPMREPNLYAAVQSMMRIYDEAKKNLIAPCEVPGFEFCAAGYYEASKLAEATAQQLYSVKPPPTIDPALATKVTDLVRKEGDRLATEGRAYAAQAETALSQGAPDAETAERIRSHAQQSRGRDSADLP
jgi:tetratricopeptide (TPR) repeat protein